MKNIRLALVIACTLFGTAVVNAQNLYDAARLMGNDLNGTARFVGMGGAMGALGGDISTMGTNPAGIGIYRSSDVMTSFGFSNIGMKSNMSGQRMNRISYLVHLIISGLLYRAVLGMKHRCGL